MGGLGGGGGGGGLIILPILLETSRGIGFLRMTLALVRKLNVSLYKYFLCRLLPYSVE